ncbi:Proteophosphoglycan 5 [Rhodotorula toruloides]|uniref:Proteophosphoglycan 5 n=1 Tax=Rhodotorula toruloides TaxID=5286 RepID=A0A2T0A175_RHOTO|nr:Proteophosphoglycan 5 [Rhodotorula toruloides]PRQ71768.1 Proteophosphoglycan 5 [Rhodotorula toruloides]
MRRIFGGTSLTGSSTSGSLASDALSSPISTTHDRSSPPATPTSEYPPGTDAHGEPKKGWFGGLGGGLTRSGSGKLTRSDTVSTTASASGQTGNSSSMTLQPAPEDFEPERLPFGQARSPPPPTSPDRGHTRSSSHSSFGTALSPRSAGANGRPFSPEAALSASTSAVQKDSLMIELLSGAAVVEAKDYDILSWEEMQELNKEHALLATRLTSLNRSVALETRLRDSAAKLVRLSAPASTLPPSNPGSPARPRVTREQAEAQLATAQAKLDTLETDLRKQTARDAELQGRLLRHTASVLATALRKKEEEIQQATAIQPALPVPSSAHRDTPSPPGSATLPRFDGAHFFAGNREAIVPLPRANGSPYASPQLGQSGTFGANAVQLQHDLAEQTGKVKELEGQVADLERALDATKQQAEEEIRAVKGDLENVETRASQEQAGAQERIRTLEEEVERLREEVDQARADHEHARSETDDARREVEEHRTQLAAFQGSSGDAQRDLDTAKQEAQDSSRKLRDMGMELAEAQHKLEEAEDRVKELEEELQRTEEEIAAERREWEEKLKAAEAGAASAPSTESQPANDGAAEARVRQLELERQTVVQSIGDVPRRHRMRPTLGVALRESPAVDDTTERDDLPAYLSSTLDSHFDKLTSHVNELNSLRDEHDTGRSDLEAELDQAHERCQNLEADVASLQAERDSLETELDLLRSQSQEHETRIASLSTLESQLEEAKAAESRGREELAAAQSRIAMLEGQLGEHDKAFSRLQDLWQSMPSLDESSPRSAAATLPGRKQLGSLFKKGGNTSTGAASSNSADYSVDNLVERVRSLSTEHQQLTQRLAVFEEEKGLAEESRKKSADTQAGLEAKVKELEERIEVSAKQEVSMLERLNDLTESLETTRAEKRKLETQIRTLEADKAALQEKVEAATAQPAPAPSASAASSADEGELQELRDQISDLEEELADVQKREQRTRAQLLEELSTVQSEVSSLKTQLRQAQRKLGAKA